ncbi:MAG TPA: YdeI/OmpD-associated family protein [Planctomycetota bacterium]|nr:YdeI/OmpD-associated family protein [Planctomycetota bacterium]
MSLIRAKATLFPSKTGALTLLRLPRSASAKLPSRGMVMIEGTLNGARFQAPLEPDGEGSHLLVVDKALRKTAGPGDTVTLAIQPSEDWPEPDVPADLKKALAADPRAQATWKDITVMARWDWIRWVNEAKQPETRQRRIGSIYSRFKAGKRRPCCFDRSQCTLRET